MCLTCRDRGPERVTGLPATMSDPAVPAPRRMRTWSIELARDERAKAVIQWTFLILVYRQVIAAPIRAFVPFAWYIPDLGVGVGFAAIIYLGLRNRVVPLVVATALTALFVLYALMLHPLGAVALAVRNVAYVMLAVFAGIGVRRGDRLLINGIAIGGAISILGVYYDHFFEVPWSDAVFSGVLQTAEVSRQWWGGGGIRRLSGFGISSTDTAVLIAVGALAMCGITQSRIRIVSALYAAAAVHTLILTTQKATAGWLFLVLLLAYIAPLLRFRMSGFQSANLLRMLGIAGLIGCILVPPIFFGMRLGVEFKVEADSLDERMAEVWPAVIPMLWSFPETLIGYGLGGVGQTATNESLATVDNMFLYMALNLGVPLTLVIFGMSAWAFLKTSIRDAVDFSALTIASILVLNGITANIWGAGGIGSIYLGFAIGCLMRPTRRSSAEAEPAAETDASPRRRRRRRSSSNAT